MANIPSLSESYLPHIPNLQHTLPTHDENGNVNMLVEIPQGSINKYEYVTEAGVIKLDRVLYEMIPYPIEYGLIPQTWDEDGDLLDVMCLITYPTFSGCLISGRVIGVMKMNDGGEVDDKIVVVPADDMRFNHIKSIEDVSKGRKDEIQFFWEHYKKLQYDYKGTPEKKTRVDGWFGVEEAVKVIEKCQKSYLKKYPKGI
ncbi:MAG: inorganic diphosphatase [bacterium]